MVYTKNITGEENYRMDNNKVLAVVNGREITERDLFNTFARVPKERQQYFSTEEGRKQLLEQLVSFELIYNYAVKENLDKDEAFTVQLENVKKEMLTQYAISKELSEAVVTEEEAKKFYSDNMTMFIEDTSIRASHILVSDIDTAEEVAKKLKNGADFGEVAAEYSSCPSKANGGDLGFFTKGRMVPEFEEAAFSLEVGQVSEPVKTQFGYHIIKVEEKKAPQMKTFEEAKDVIVSNLTNYKQNSIYNNLVNGLKEQYGVEYK